MPGIAGYSSTQRQPNISKVTHLNPLKWRSKNELHGAKVVDNGQHYRLLDIEIQEEMSRSSGSMDSKRRWDGKILTKEQAAREMARSSPTSTSPRPARPPTPLYEDPAKRTRRPVTPTPPPRQRRPSQVPIRLAASPTPSRRAPSPASYNRRNQELPPLPLQATARPVQLRKTNAVKRSQLTIGTGTEQPRMARRRMVSSPEKPTLERRQSDISIASYYFGSRDVLEIPTEPVPALPPSAKALGKRRGY